MPRPRPRLVREIAVRLTKRVGAPPETAPAEPFDPADPPAVRLAVVGDVGTGSARAYATADAVRRAGAERPFDGLVLLGDNVYPHGDPDRLDATVFRPFAPVLGGGARLLGVLGNHDVERGHGDRHAARLGMPAPWYVARLGPVLFVGLDTNRMTDPTQRAWLDETLAAADVPWKIAAAHFPPYSSGRHGSDLATRAAFAPAFERHGVQLVLSGHEHDYQRSSPVGGVTYVVSGAAAKLRRTGREDFTAAAWSTHHFVDLAAWPDRLVLRATDQKGRVFDAATLALGTRVAAGPVARPHEAARTRTA